MSDRPRYVARGGDLVLAQPIQNDRVRSFAWFLDADWDALAALTRRAFTEPSGGAVDVRPLLPLVAVVCADIGHGQSMVAPDHDKGWATERDLGFWVPVARGRDDGERFHVEQVGWYQPYLFVDNAAGVLTGRETYGFAKLPGVCRMPVRPGDPARFAVETLVIERFAPTSRAEVVELFRLERSGDGLFGALESSFGNALEAFLAVQARLLLRGLGRGGLPVPTLQLLGNLAEQVRHGLVPMLFLKQFRAVEDPAACCYQGIVEAACDLTAWRGGGFLDEHVLSIRHADSHPIAADLGLAPGPLETGFGFWADYDFRVLPGTTLWQRHG
jgi:hypothetical protein